MITRIVQVGDAALTAEIDGPLSIALNRRAVALARRTRALALTGVRDVIVTAANVTVHYDPSTADPGAIAEALGVNVEPEPEADVPPVVVPVRYGGVDGPDLVDVAQYVRVPRG